jgi:hypothetical protein
MRKPSWTYNSRVYTQKALWTIYRDDALGVQLQVVTKRDRAFARAKDKCYFFIDGVDRKYRSEEQMIRALAKWRFVASSPLRSRWSLDSMLSDDRNWKASLSRG